MNISTDKIPLAITADDVPLGSHLIHFWNTEEEFERGVRFFEPAISDETQYCVISEPRYKRHRSHDWSGT